MRISDWSSDVCSSDLIIYILPLVCKHWRVRCGQLNFVDSIQLIVEEEAPLLFAPPLATLNRVNIHEIRVSFCGPRVWDFVFARSEEHTSELQSLMRISYAVFCLKKEKQWIIRHN